LEYVGKNIGTGNVAIIIMPISVLHIEPDAFLGFEYKSIFLPEHCSKMNLQICQGAKVSYNNNFCRLGLSKKLVKKRSVKGAKYQGRTDDELYNC
jgi:hypothetical protein